MYPTDKTGAYIVLSKKKCQGIGKALINMSEQELNKIDYSLPFEMEELYTSPMDAALRETVWNAMDAEKCRYGEVRNVTININSTLLPQYYINNITVIISDSGDGMTEEKVLQRFIPYTFENNRFIGCGSKAPLLVTRSMDVYTRRSGGSVLHTHIERDPLTGELGYTTPRTLENSEGCIFVGRKHGTTVCFNIPNMEEPRAAFGTAILNIQTATAGLGVIIKQQDYGTVFRSTSISGASQYSTTNNWGENYCSSIITNANNIARDIASMFPPLGSIVVDGVECRASIIGSDNVAACLLRDDPGILVRCGSWIYQVDDNGGSGASKPLYSYIRDIQYAGSLNPALPLILVDVPEEIIGFDQSKDHLVGCDAVLSAISNAVRELFRNIRCNSNSTTHLIGSVEYPSWGEALARIVAPPSRTHFNVIEVNCDNDNGDGNITGCYQLLVLCNSDNGDGYVINLNDYTPRITECSGGVNTFADLLQDPSTLSYLMTRDNTGHFKVRSNIAASDNVTGAVTDIISNSNNVVNQQLGAHVVKQAPSRADRDISNAALPLRVAHMFSKQWLGLGSTRTVLVDARLCDDITSVRRALPSIMGTLELDDCVTQLVVLVVAPGNSNDNPVGIKALGIHDCDNNVNRFRYSPNVVYTVGSNAQRGDSNDVEGDVNPVEDALSTPIVVSPCQYLVDDTTTRKLVEGYAADRRSGNAQRLEECRRALIDAVFAFEETFENTTDVYRDDNIYPDNTIYREFHWMLEKAAEAGESPVFDDTMCGDYLKCQQVMLETKRSTRWHYPIHLNAIREYNVDAILEHISSDKGRAAMAVVPTMGQSKKLAGLRGLSVAFAADALGLHSTDQFNIIIGTTNIHLNAKRVEALRDIGVEIIYDHTGKLVPNASIPTQMFSFEFNGDVKARDINTNIYDNTMKPTYHGDVPGWAFNYYRSVRAVECMAGEGHLWAQYYLCDGEWVPYVLAPRDCVTLITSLGAKWAEQWCELITNHSQIYCGNVVDYRANLLRGVNIPKLDAAIGEDINAFRDYCYELAGIWAPVCDEFNIKLRFSNTEDINEVLANVTEIADVLGVSNQIRGIV